MKSFQNPEDIKEIIERLRALRPDSRRQWGRMTAPQMICHLNDSFLVCMSAREVSLATGLLQRTLMKWLALYLPLPWPKGVKTRPEVDQEIGGTRPAEFERDRQELEKTIIRFTQPDRDFAWSPHPIFGMMPDRDWMRWGWLHADHHLRQFGL
jgi:hypothetical protein